MKKLEQKSKSASIRTKPVANQPEPSQPTTIHSGGILKLNTEALNQLKASQKCEDDVDADVKQYVKNFRNLKYSGSRASNTEDNAGSEAPQKMLFNPNNPDKPIYVADNSSHIKQKQQMKGQHSPYSRQQLPQQQLKQRDSTVAR